MKCPHCKKEINLKEEKIRSIPQSKYYFGVVIDLLCEHLGYTAIEMHEILKELFLKAPIHLKTKDGLREIWISRSTAELSTVAFETYLSDIREWASLELSVFIPLPNEKGLEDYNEKSNLV